VPFRGVGEWKKRYEAYPAGYCQAGKSRENVKFLKSKPLYVWIIIGFLRKLRNQRSERMREKRRYPFSGGDKDGNVILHTRDGEDKLVTWEEFVKLVKTPLYQNNKYRLIPEDEFEKWYKRMKMPNEAREYHKERKRVEQDRK